MSPVLVKDTTEKRLRLAFKLNLAVSIPDPRTNNTCIPKQEPITSSKLPMGIQFDI